MKVSWSERYSLFGGIDREAPCCAWRERPADSFCYRHCSAKCSTKRLPINQSGLKQKEENSKARDCQFMCRIAFHFVLSFRRGNVLNIDYLLAQVTGWGRDAEN